MRPSSLVSARQAHEQETFATGATTTASLARRSKEEERKTKSKRTEHPTPPVVPDQSTLLQQYGGGVYNIGALLLEERVVFLVVRVDRVERGGAEHADVEVGVAEPVGGRRGEYECEKRKERKEMREGREKGKARAEGKEGKRTIEPPRHGCGWCRGRSQR